MGERSAENIIIGVNKSKQVPFERVLFALGIRFVGETVAKKLARTFLSIDNLQKATFEELLQIDEIGERIAQSVIEFFADEQNQKIIERLKSYGLQTQIIRNENEHSDKLKGITFVVSGVFEKFSREQLKNMMENNGAKVASSISSKTNYIVAGENMGPSKLEKAQKLNIPIISELDFEKMLEN